MNLRFTKRALENLSEIADYLNERNPQAAIRVRASIEEGVRHLLRFPFAGRAQSAADVRKLVTPKYSYLVYYTVDLATDELIILSVQHPARKREHDDA